MKEFKKTAFLALFFAKRDLKSRFAGSVLGASWLFIYPVCLILMFTFVFSMVLRIKIPFREGGSFLPFFLSAFFPWLALQEGIMRASSSVLENAEAVKKVPFSLEAMPLGLTLSSFVYHISSFLLFYFVNLLIKTIHGGVSQLLLIKGIVLLPVLFSVQFLMASGIGLILSSICTYVRDLIQVTSLLLQVWFYATPVVYPLKMVPESLRTVIYLNPYFGLTQGYREVVFKGWMEFSPEKVYSFMFSLAVFFVGWKIFGRLKHGFADVL